MKPGALPPRLPPTGPAIARPVTSTVAPPAPTTSTAPSTPPAPLASAATTAPRTAEHSGAPAWATPAYFHGLQQKAASSSSLTGGSGLNVRLGALLAKPATVSTTTTSAAPTTAQRATGVSLLARAAHAMGVVTGRPLTADEIASAPPALHLTRPEHVDGILRDGLRPTTGVYKNLTTWCRRAVYMFEREPSAYQKLANFSAQQAKTTAVVEIDLKQLDPDKLYKRLVDNALIYVSNDPIPVEALRLRSDGRS